MSLVQLYITYDKVYNLVVEERPHKLDVAIIDYLACSTQKVHFASLVAKVAIRWHELHCDALHNVLFVH